MFRHCRHIRKEGERETYHTDKAPNMPLRSECLDNRIRDRFPASLALCTVPVGMAIHTPGIPVLLHKGRRAVKRITALGAEKVPGMPFRTTRYNDFAFDGRLAALASRREELVEVEMAVEAWRFVCAVIVLEARHVVSGSMRGEIGYVLAGKAGAYSVNALGVLVRGLGVEGYAFEVLATLIASEALGMEA